MDIRKLTWDDVYPARFTGNSDDEFRAWCPYCQPEKRKQGPHADGPSLRINGLGAWNCKRDHKCGKKGFIADNADMSITRHQSSRNFIPKPAAEKVYVKPSLEKENIIPATAGVYDFFQRRGISQATVDLMGVKAKRGFNGDDIAAYIHVDRTGSISHIQYRVVTSKNMWTTKNTYAPFYGLQLLEKNPDTIVIVEGMTDLLSMVEAGVKNSLAVPMGANGSPAYFDSAADELSSAQRIIIAVDNDEPGQKLAAEIERRFPGRSARIRHPEGCKDINDILVMFGPQSVRDVVYGVPEPQMEGVSMPRSAVEDSIRDWKRGNGNNEKGIRTSKFHSFSDIFRIQPGALHVVIGASTAGKSSFLRSLTMYAMDDNVDLKTAYFVPEDWQDSEFEFWDKFITARRNKPKGQFTENEIRSDYDVLHDMMILLNPEGGRFDNLIEQMEFAVRIYGVNCIVIDPMTQIRFGGGGYSKKDDIDDALDDLLNFGKKWGVAMIVAAHPNLSDGRAAREDGKELWLDSASGSHGWQTKAVMGLAVTKSAEGLTTCRVVKSKDYWTGQMGKAVQFRHNVVTGNFTEIGPE